MYSLLKKLHFCLITAYFKKIFRKLHPPPQSKPTVFSNSSSTLLQSPGKKKKKNQSGVQVLGELSPSRNTIRARVIARRSSRSARNRQSNVQLMLCLLLLLLLSLLATMLNSPYVQYSTAHRCTCTTGRPQPPRKLQPLKHVYSKLYPYGAGRRKKMKKEEK